MSWSKTGSSRSGTALLVLLHGYGAHERDLFSITGHLPEEFTVASVRAPVATPGGGFGWFNLQAVEAESRNRTLLYTLDEVRESTEHMAQWIDGVRADHSSIALLGFSQGMSIASSLLRYRPEDFAAIVGLSGFVVEDSTSEFFQDPQLNHPHVPFFWGLDPHDPVIPAELEHMSDQWLCQHTQLHKVLYPGIGHTIAPQQLADVNRFLRMNVIESDNTLGQSPLKGTVFDRADTGPYGIVSDAEQ